MGSILSYFWPTKKEAKLLMIGLDAAGKTTIRFRLIGEKNFQPIPTIGMNVQTVTYNKLSFTISDIGGCDKIRLLWRHYYAGVNGIIFVIDSNDRDRI